MSSKTEADEQWKRRKVWRPKPKTPSLSKLCRAVIIKNTGLHRLRKARKDLPLPRNLIDFLTSDFSFREFEVQSLNLPRDMRIHCIYPTRSLLDNSKVLLKCINVKACNSTSVSRLLDKWAEISHKNIMQVLLWFRDRETVGVVLEPFPKSLYELVHEYRRTGVKFSEWLLWKMLNQICDALWYLQRRKIVHTEIQSKTLSLSNTGDILLHNLLIYTPSETELNVCLDGKDSFYGIYVAPERIRGQRHSNKQDSWSLGCVAFELMYLEPAFPLRQGENIFETLNNIVNGVPPARLTEAESLYSSDIGNLIVSCLMPEPRLRPTIEDIFYITKERMRLTRPN
ncbi:serine/threonine-protein kinase Nek7-like [Oculina patagonica]